MSEKLDVQGTADICDANSGSVQVFKPVFKSYGGTYKCSGEILTVSLDENNETLRSLLKTPGEGRVAVVDVKGDFYAVVGDHLGSFAVANNWTGIIINGYVRDTENLKNMPIAIWALGTCPRKSFKKAEGIVGEPLEFAGVKLNTGDHLYSDDDGIIVAEKAFDNIAFTG